MASAAMAAATSTRGGAAMEGERERGGGPKMAASPSPFLRCTRARVLFANLLSVGFLGSLFLGAKAHFGGFFSVAANMNLERPHFSCEFYFSVSSFFIDCSYFRNRFNFCIILYFRASSI